MVDFPPLFNKTELTEHVRGQTYERMKAERFAAAELVRPCEQGKSKGSRGRRSGSVAISLGDVVIEDDDVYGEGVNVAARPEVLPKGGVCMSVTVTIIRI